MNIPLKSIAKVLISCILMAAAWYIIMIIGISLCAPQEVRIRLRYRLQILLHCVELSAAGKFMIITALCGILTSWNGFILGSTRVIFAMGRAKMLPPVFGKVHPKYQTPTAAIVLVGILHVFLRCLERALWYGLLTLAPLELS